MATIYSNYDVLTLSGTQDMDVLGDGITGSSVHRIYCITAGNVTITPMRGDSFLFTATANQFIDIVAKKTVLNAGAFIAMKAKHIPNQFFGS